MTTEAAVFFSLLASLSAFVWGAIKTVALIVGLIASSGKDPLAAVAFIELMDGFLIATGLLIFALGLYELFVHDLALPEWLMLHNLHDLKVRLSSVIIMVMGGKRVRCVQKTRMSPSAACLVLRW